MATLQLQSIGKKYVDRFGEHHAVENFDLRIEDGEFLVLVGPSGCGKSTTLRMIAGLEESTSGRIFIDGNDVTDLAPKRRDIAMVFQNYALYPHMTVRENIGFGLKIQRKAADEIARKVASASRILGLDALLDRKPRALSGGQRQRVAMGRALVRDPKVFLFDEPLSNLDAKLRVQMRQEIRDLHQKLGATMVYVTHDQVEAMTLATRIVVMNAGRIEQVGTPDEIYNRPASKFVAEFIGAPMMNFLKGTLVADDGGIALRMEDGQRIELPPSDRGILSSRIGRPAYLAFRPEVLGPTTADADALRIMMDETHVEDLGPVRNVYGRVGDSTVSYVDSTGTHRNLGGQGRYPVTVPASKIFYYDGTAEKMIERGQP